MNFSTLYKAFQFMMIIEIVFGATKSKPHGHMGLLEPYDGQLLPVKVTADQSAKLEKGLPVTYNERVGRSGRGVVIQDINASEPICMEKIRDLLSYPKMVPNVKSVNVYDIIKFPNGTSQTRAEFRVGALGLRFGYYLLLTHEPKYKTLTWTLDYKFNSDFDDNVGHWQVMPHPTKKGWSRVLFSTKVKLFAWIPEFIVNFLTGKALVESTTWLKKESEEAARNRGSVDDKADPLKKWFINGGATFKKWNAETKHKADNEISRYKAIVSNISPRIRWFKTLT